MGEYTKAINKLELISEDYWALVESLDQEDLYLKEIKKEVQRLGDLIVNAAYNICPKYDLFDKSVLTFPEPSIKNRYSLVPGHLVIYQRDENTPNSLRDHYHYLRLHYFSTFFKYHNL